MSRHPDTEEDHPADDLEKVNGLLAEWAARSAATSGPLTDRFEAMGYEVRGKGEEEIVEVLRKPPTRPAR
ncbi:hypothetical protein [Methylobacterium persicinum]|uniref:Transketolase N-terminal domain/subunit n=1 Tax=Methylobacterium persicinum TaxID=374426 RepID=A0ABU0HFL5_9HYPH|nr:hypothetical protein [Methylobacterium persicinum]MDQ0441114.1 transketolase N-terminal domain/subunit [Methylobacterium persicinum]GJE40121.1 hypothetical protein KHHGKMAE_4211 [Methylobacterium persicinum]